MKECCCKVVRVILGSADWQSFFITSQQLWEPIGCSVSRHCYYVLTITKTQLLESYIAIIKQSNINKFKISLKQCCFFYVRGKEGNLNTELHAIDWLFELTSLGK